MSGQVQVGASTVTVEQFSGRKTLIAERIIRRAVRQFPELFDAYVRFKTDYERKNISSLDRSEAVFRFGARAAAIADADWEASRHKLNLGSSPSTNEIVGAMWPVVMDAAEDEVLRLLGLVVTPSGDLKRAKDGGGGQDAVDQLLLSRGEDLLDEATNAADLIELAMVAAETLRDQFTAAGGGLGPRVGRLLESVGIRRTSSSSAPDPTSSETPTDGSESARPTSSTSAPADTAGSPTSP